MKKIEITENEAIVLALLVGIGAAAFDVPAGPAYVLKSRLELKHKFIITTDDIINVTKKVQGALSKEGDTKP